MPRKDIARLAGYLVTLGLVFLLATGQVFTDIAGNVIESHVPAGTQSWLVLGCVVVCASVLALLLDRGKRRNWWMLGLLLVMQLVIAIYKNRVTDLLPGGSPNKHWRAYLPGIPIAVAAVCVAEIWLVKWVRWLQYSKLPNLRKHIRDQMARQWGAHQTDAVDSEHRLRLCLTIDAQSRTGPREVTGDNAAMLDAVLHCGAMLVLAGPGLGKTIKLTDIVMYLKRLGKRAPVPIMMDLARYRANSRDIEPWITRDLEVPRKAMARLLRLEPAGGGPVVLLDGLDHVRQELRKECVTAIVRFHETYPHIPVVVTATPDTGSPLPGFALAELHPPTADDVHRVLAAAGVTPNGDLYQALDNNPEVAEFLRSPLVLSIATVVWPGIDRDKLRSVLDLPGLVDRYLERQLEEQKPDLPYPVEDMHRWLRFIARTQEVLFRADEVDWCDVPGKAVHAWQQFIPACALAALGGIFAAQADGGHVDWVDVVIGAAAGFGVAIWKEGSFGLRPRLRVDWHDVFNPVALRRGAIRGVKIVSACVAVILAFLLASSAYGYVHGWISNHRYSMQWWDAGATPAEDAGQVALVILGAPAAGLFLGVLITVIGRSFRSAAEADQDIAVTRRALRSAASGVQMTTAAWSLFLIMGAFDQLVNHEPMTGWLLLGVVPSICVGLYFGGYAALDRLAVRLYLYQVNYLPRSIERFLDQIGGRGIMIREGLGYKFRHNLIRDYISELDE